jgi:hypothetical protein
MQRILALPKYEPVRKEVDGERTYITPIGDAKSVTTILSGSRDQTSLEEWRENVGEERANFIRDFACFRGNNHHNHIEQYLLTGVKPELDWIAESYWKSTRDFLSTVDHTLVTEGAIWHPLGYAGTFDCVAYLEDDTDQPSLLDWKTADKYLKPDKMYDYCLQASAYVKAINYVYGSAGIQIRRAKVVVAVQASLPQIEELDEEALDQYFLHFQARLERFTFARSKR